MVPFFATQKLEIKLETNVKLEFDEEIPTLPAPDRITIGDDFIGCIEDIVWMGTKLTFDPENSLSFGFLRFTSTQSKT